MSPAFKISQLSSDNTIRWNNFFLNSAYPFYTGSLGYALSQQSNNREISTFILQKDTKDIAGAHYFLKSSTGGFLKIADIDSALYYIKPLDEESASNFIKHYLLWAKKNNASYIRIHPGLQHKGVNNEISDYHALNKILLSSGFKPILQGRHTYWIDLNLSEKELLQNMKPQTRSKIWKAEQSDITTEIYESFDPEYVYLFWKLYNQLGNRKGFNTLSKERFQAEIKALMDTGATLFVMNYNGEIINIALCTNFGIASYYHGALNPDYKKLEGCPASGHFMQWTMIKYLKLKGLKYYDMAFCPGPIPIKDHPQFNMWRFKYGFGGMHIQFMPTYGMKLKNIKGSLFSLLRYRKLI